MLKISLFFIIFLAYLGLAKTFSPDSRNFPLVKGVHYYQSAIDIPNRDEPLSLILKRQYKTGVFFKTYLQEYLLIRSYKQTKTLTVRTTKSYFNQCTNKIGLSLFRISTYHRTSLIPSPAGFNFIGNPTLGRWKRDESGEKKWYFYTAYQNFYKKNLPIGSKLYHFAYYKKVLLATTSSQSFYLFIKPLVTQTKDTTQKYKIKTFLKHFFKQQLSLTLFGASKVKSL